MTTPTRFTVHTEDAALEDLRARLARTRWPDQLAGAGWDYGTELEYLRGLTEYWRDGFDWRAKERELNRLPHFMSTVDGQPLHFLHSVPEGPKKPFPLVMVHGWPQSFYEFAKLVEPLNRAGFEVIVPSLPGFTFSPPARERGMSAQKMATLLHGLVKSLGHERYGLVGEDWGSTVAARMAFENANRVVGLHINMPTENPHSDNMKDLSDTEQKWLKDMGKWRASEAAYWALQSTKPQTLAYGLSDSPVGVASWLVEKFRAWSDCDGDLERTFPRDELLTNVMLYWMTNCINSANRIYFESGRAPWRFSPTDKIQVPTAVTRHPKELVRPPREWIERVYNLQRLTDMPKGGHFPSQETPDLVAADVTTFFSSLA